MSKPRSLSDLVPGLAKDILGRKGALFGKLLLEWPHIAGPEIAACTRPLELRLAGKSARHSQAVLHLAVASAAALELSYQKALLLERINMFFGYPAVRDIKLRQQTDFMANNRRPPPSRPPLTVQEELEIEKTVGVIQENDLQTALKNLGKAIISLKVKD